MTVQASFEFSGGPIRFDQLDVSASNAAALDLLKSARDWPFSAICLIGPPRSGLTTISSLWAAHFGADRLVAAELGEMPAETLNMLAAGYLVMDDADRGVEESQLLFLLNQVAEKKGRILLTAHTSPSNWAVKSRDLASRLTAMTLAEIAPMDGDMYRTRLESLLDRYRLKHSEEVAAYTALRLERTYADVEEYVTRLAGRTGPGQGLTVPLARAVLDEMYGRAGDDEGEDDDET